MKKRRGEKTPRCGGWRPEYSEYPSTVCSAGHTKVVAALKWVLQQKYSNEWDEADATLNRKTVPKVGEMSECLGSGEGELLALLRYDFVR